MADDLIERLRVNDCRGPLLFEAADEIERLRALNAERADTIGRMMTANVNLVAERNAAEARAEKAERERDAAREALRAVVAEYPLAAGAMKWRADDGEDRGYGSIKAAADLLAALTPAPDTGEGA